MSEKPYSLSRVSRAADAYIAGQGIEHSGGIVEAAFEAGSCWASHGFLEPYGYVFGGCTFISNGSPLATDYVKNHSLEVFVRPAEDVMRTYREVMAQKIGDNVSTLSPASNPSAEAEQDRLRRMVERRDEFIIGKGLWDLFEEASREAE